MNRKPKVVLITGAARGIGYGIAENLANNGCQLLINDIVTSESVASKLDALRRAGAEVYYCRADISDTSDRYQLISAIDRYFGHIDVLVNNAGVAPDVREDILKASENSFERVLRINLKGPYFLTRAIANRMIVQRQTETEGHFCILNIASSNSLAASVNRGEYCISKAGVSMATRLWASRLGEYNIPVYEIRPGIIATEMTAAVKPKYDRMISEGLLLQKRWGQPADVGKAVKMLVNGDLGYATGQVLYIDGGQLISNL